MLKANGFYTEVYFAYNDKFKSIIICKPIKQVHEELDAPDLMRVHRSYVINLKKIIGVKKRGSNLNSRNRRPHRDTGGKNQGN